MFEKINCKLKVRLVILISFLLLSIFISQNIYAKNNKVQVIAGITPLKTFVDKIGGEKVETTVMIPPGYSPANYAPSPSELQKLSDAEYYFTFQMPAEKANILPKLENFNESLKLIKLDKITSEKYEPRNFDDGGIDPHIWMSPKRVKYMVKIITDKLVKIDPQNKGYYLQRKNNYLDELNKMDIYINDKLKDLKGKTVLIYHPVLGYFTDEYRLELKSIEKNGKDATPKRMQNLIDFAREENIKTIFYQAEIANKQPKIIASEIDGKTVKINPLAADFVENMKEIADFIFDSYQ